MKLTTDFNDLRNAAMLCLKCGCCSYGAWPENYTLCPLYFYDKSLTASPGGFVYIFRALLEGNIDYSQSLAELIYNCPMCEAADNLCPIFGIPDPHASLSDMVRLLRYQLIKQGLIPEKMREIYDVVQREGDYLGGEIDLKVPEKIWDEKAETVLFGSCFHSNDQIGMYECALTLLEKIGDPISLYYDRGCCGSTLYDLGLWDQLQPLMEAKGAKMKALEGKKIIFINPHCQEFVTKRYPEIIPDFKGLQSYHISEILEEAFSMDKLHPKKAGKVRVAYHDPCRLGRGLGIYDAPRKVLCYLNNVELVELKRNRENSFCCGAGALGEYFPNFREETAKERIKEFQTTGADLLITSCPYCKATFQKAMPDEDKGLVKDLLELVNERTQ